jgi:MoaA/NifB/PqqE/SkfB family radical SAM enzyme
MAIQRIPEPYSAGVLLSYKCTSACRHCMYACSPDWDAKWLDADSAEIILSQLFQAMRGKYPHPGRVGVNDGVHFTGGEPFLNFNLLVELTGLAGRPGIPTTFAETNGFWATNDRIARERLRALKEAGLDGILISANPFILEHVPFERTERAVRISKEVFGSRNVIVYEGLGTIPLFQILGTWMTMRYMPLRDTCICDGGQTWSPT